MRAIWNEQGAVLAPGQVERVSAWQQPRRLRCVGLAQEQALIRCQEPSFTNRRTNGVDFLAKLSKRVECFRIADSCPACKRESAPRTKNVQIATRKFKPRLQGTHLWRINPPDGGLARSIPTQQNGSGRCCVAQTIRMNSQQLSGFAKGHGSVAKKRSQAFACTLGSAMRLRARGKTP